MKYTKGKILANFTQCKGGLDDDYILYEDGTVLHEYDRSTAPGNYNLKEYLEIKDLKDKIKEGLLLNASQELKDKVSKILWSKD